MSAEGVCDFTALERFNLHDYYLARNLEEGRGEKVCLVVGEETRTYAELEERVARCAAALRALGVVVHAARRRRLISDASGHFRTFHVI